MMPGYHAWGYGNYPSMRGGNYSPMSGGYSPSMSGGYYNGWSMQGGGGVPGDFSTLTDI
jgi:hypothetical protein